ncbi:MAG: metal-dependent transcriptional regulator [Patescibacteria group bacterium]|nr:metal-dependent transcriptional regulator [Patescibacteria group bacterium]
MNEKMNDRLSSNMEDYLETIASLEKRNDVVRLRDISRALGVKSSSVNSALKNLAGKNLLKHEKYGYVKLTPEGESIALTVQSRHDILLKFLTRILGIEDDTAINDACKMEHSISKSTFVRLTKFMQFVENGMDGETPKWLNHFKQYIETGKKPDCKIAVKKQKK